MKNSEFLVIDGSLGEGGGQILRSAVALSALFLRPVKVTNIRAKRRNPGLQAQHLAAVKAVAAICGAHTQGLEVGSSQLEFAPHKIEGGGFRIDVGTAGAVTLILQSILIASCGTENAIELELIGGTNVPWSPPFEYLDWVTLSILNHFGYRGSVDLLRRGFYPKGGGKVEAKIFPPQLRAIDLSERGDIKKIFGISCAEERLLQSKVAERQRDAALGVLNSEFPELEPAIEINYAPSYSLGSGVVLAAEATFSRLGASSLGEKGKRAESVGEEAAQSLLQELESGAALDSHMADQIVPYLALAGGEITVSRITEHTRTNIQVMRLFGLEVKQQGNYMTAEGGK